MKIHSRLFPPSPLFILGFLLIGFFPFMTTGMASPEELSGHREAQVGQHTQEVLRPDASAGNGPAQDGFGDHVGTTIMNDEDWEKQASAAGLTTENFSEVDGRHNEEQYSQDLEGIEKRTGPTAEELERQRRYELQQIRVFEEELERQNRLAALDRERRNQERQRASEASRRFAERAQRDGKWTDEEYDEYERLTTAENIAWEFTAEEAAEMERLNAVRTGVVDEIRRAAANVGGTSDAEIAERAQNANMVDAGTKTWRNATFTGRMVNEVGRDITAQRELGIRANNTMMAAQAYMNRTDISDEQRAAAQQVYDAAHFARGAAADAIGKDTALILSGTAADVAVLGVGRPVSLVAGKVGQGVRSIWNGVFGGTEAAAGAAGAEAGAALGTEVAAGTRAAGTEAGTVAGTRAASTEAGATGRAAGEEAGAAGSGKPPSQMTRAERQAHAEARGDADIKGVLSNPARELIDGGTHVLPAPSGAVVQPAVGELSKGLTQAEINVLFKPGANLTGEQIVQKADLLMTGYRPPVIGGSAPQLPGVVAGAADNAATVILPAGQGVVTGTAAEAGTIITGAGGRGAAAASAETGTVITGAGGRGAAEAAGATTIINPAPAASSQAGTIITGAGGRGVAEAAGSTTIINPAPAASSQAGTILTGAGGRGAAEATGATTIIERTAR